MDLISLKAHFLGMIHTIDESELSSARIQLELARLVGFSARLSSARGIFGPARDLEMLPERAKSAL